MFLYLLVNFNWPALAQKMPEYIVVYIHTEKRKGRRNKNSSLSQNRIRGQSYSSAECWVSFNLKFVFY